eukprot:756811-Hanusia_phi.AAC.4
MKNNDTWNNAGRIHAHFLGVMRAPGYLLGQAYIAHDAQLCLNVPRVDHGTEKPSKHSHGRVRRGKGRGRGKGRNLVRVYLASASSSRACKCISACILFQTFNLKDSTESASLHLIGTFSPLRSLTNTVMVWEGIQPSARRDNWCCYLVRRGLRPLPRPASLAHSEPVCLVWSEVDWRVVVLDAKGISANTSRKTLCPLEGHHRHHPPTPHHPPPMH